MFSRIIKTLLCFTRGTMWENFFEGKKISLFSNLFFSVSVEKFSEWLSKLPFDFPDEHFVWNLLFKKTYKVITLFSFRVKVYWQDCQNFFYNFGAIIEEKTFVWKILQLHKFLSSFGWKIYSRIVKIMFIFSRRTLCEKNFAGKNIDIRHCSSGFGWKTFVGMVKNAL